MKVPTICHICSYGPEYGGTFIESLVFLSRHCRDNLQLATFCIFPEKAKDRSWLSKLDNEGIGYGFVPNKRSVVREVRNLLSSCEPVVIHTHFFLFDITAIIIKCTTFMNATVVWHYHSQPASTRRQKFKDFVKLGLILRMFGDRCIAVGDGIYKGLQNVAALGDKAVLIRNAINARRFSPCPDVRSRVRQSLGVQDETVLYLLLGYAPIIKGVDLFIRAAAQVVKTHELKARFLIVGREKTRIFVAEQPDSVSVKDVLTVIDPVEDFSYILNAVDVLVSASRTEGLAFSVLEAMSAEKPILSSDISSVRETYGRSEGVWLFPSEDWTMLGDLMLKIGRLQPAGRLSLGRMNSQYVMENHSIEQWSEQVGQVYAELLGRHNLLPVTSPRQK